MPACHLKVSIKYICLDNLIIYATHLEVMNSKFRIKRDDRPHSLSPSLMNKGVVFKYMNKKKKRFSPITGEQSCPQVCSVSLLRVNSTIPFSILAILDVSSTRSKSSTSKIYGGKLTWKIKTV